MSAIAAVTEPDDFIGAAIDGLPDSWSPFIASVTGRSKSQTPLFEEFARLQRRSGPSGKTGEKDLVLSAKFKKDKRPRSKKLQKDGNLSHIRCFRCDQPGHYAKDCKKFPPQRKQSSKSKRKRFQASAAVEEMVEAEHLRRG